MTIIVSPSTIVYELASLFGPADGIYPTKTEIKSARRPVTLKTPTLYKLLSWVTIKANSYFLYSRKIVLKDHVLLPLTLSKRGKGFNIFRLFMILLTLPSSISRKSERIFGHYRVSKTQFVIFAHPSNCVLGVSIGVCLTFLGMVVPT